MISLAIATMAIPILSITRKPRKQSTRSIEISLTYHRPFHYIKQKNVMIAQIQKNVRKITVLIAIIKFSQILYDTEQYIDRSYIQLLAYA
jgi:hypothetical protein